MVILPLSTLPQPSRNPPANPSLLPPPIFSLSSSVLVCLVLPIGHGFRFIYLKNMNNSPWRSTLKNECPSLSSHDLQMAVYPDPVPSNPHPGGPRLPGSFPGSSFIKMRILVCLFPDHEARRSQRDSENTWVLPPHLLLLSSRRWPCLSDFNPHNRPLGILGRCGSASEVWAGV